MPNWKRVIVSGSDAALNSLNVSTSLTASGLIYPTADNGEESFIQTDGNGTLSLQYVKTIYEEIYNGEATQLVKGTPVYVSGSVGAAARVFRADAGNPAKMPVIYISADTLAAGQTGRGIALGLIKGVNTTGYPAGTEVYVAVGGGWTSTRPTGSAIVQTLGYVTKEGAGGQGVVLNPGPNSLPNLPSGSVWVGSSSSLPTPVLTSSLSVASASFASTASFLSSTTNGFIQNGNSFGTTATLGTNDNQSLQFETNGTTKMFISSSGNVGIGLTNPIRKLDVLGGATFGSSQGAVEIGNSGTTGYISGHNGLIISTNHLNVGLASGEKVRITSAGNVGIGTTSPYSTLQVGDTEQTTSAQLTIASRYGNSAPILNFRSGHPNNSNVWNMARIVSDDDGNYNGRLEFQTTVSGGNTGTEPQVRMVIKATGFVGINETSPTERLHIAGRARITTIDNGTGDFATISGTGVITRRTAGQVLGDIGAQAALTNPITGTGTTNFLSKFTGATSLGNSQIFDNGTNVGIGTTSIASSRFTIAGGALPTQDNGNANALQFAGGVTGRRASSNTVGFIGTYTNTSTIEISAGLSGAGLSMHGSTASVNANSLLLYTNNSEVMRINSAGNIGIGTTSPNAKLDVQGTLIVSSSILQYSNNASITSGSTANVASFSTGSYTAGFFDYVATSGTNARAGTVFTVWNANNVEFTETSTNDIGSTSNLVLSASLSAGAIRLQATSLSGSWSVKTLARML
jgi:hypothetical protein